MDSRTILNLQSADGRRCLELENFDETFLLLVTDYYRRSDSYLGQTCAETTNFPLSPDHALVLLRGLASIVLPKVDRHALKTSRYCGPGEEIAFCAPLGVCASAAGRSVVQDGRMMSVEVARALAACLLAAADEAEGSVERG